MVPLVHPPHQANIPGAVERDTEHGGDPLRFLRRGEDPPGPIPLQVDQEKIVGVDPATLEECLHVRLVGDELPKLLRRPDGHASSLGVAAAGAQVAGIGAWVEIVGESALGVSKLTDTPWCVL
jgi:hypothetical protein